MSITIRPTRKLSIPIIVFIVLLFLYISADKIYGSDVGKSKTLLTVYMVMILGTVAFTGIKPDKVQGLFNPLNFFVFFLGSSIIFLVLPKISALSAYSGLATSSLPYGLLGVLVIAYTEETVFRGALPLIFGDLGSSVLFGAFHWAVSGAFLFLIFATVAGLLFTFIRDYFGLYASMGVHAAFDTKVIGLLDPLIRGVA